MKIAGMRAMQIMIILLFYEFLGKQMTKFLTFISVCWGGDDARF